MCWSVRPALPLARGPLRDVQATPRLLSSGLGAANNEVDGRVWEEEITLRRGSVDLLLGAYGGRLRDDALGAGARGG